VFVGGRLCRWFSRTFDCDVIKIQELLKASVGGEFSFRIIQPGTRIMTKGSDTCTATRKFFDKISYRYFTFFPNSEEPKHLPSRAAAENIAEMHKGSAFIF
jgi:hypothetical protein